MKMTRTRAVTFFVNLGWPNAKEWPDEKLISRLAQVPDKFGDKKEEIPTSCMPVYDELCEDKGKVELMAEPGEAPKKGRPVSVTPDEEPQRDKEGAALGSIRAAVNAALVAQWKTDKMIAKEAGVGLQQARRYLRKIMQEGKLEKRQQIIYRLK